MLFFALLLLLLLLSAEGTCQVRSTAFAVETDHPMRRRRKKHSGIHSGVAAF